MTENNKLIAVFMGMKPLNNDSSVLVLSTDRGNDIVFIDNLEYQKDWNLLMEVVQRITDLNNVVEIHDNHVRVVSNERNNALIDVVEGSMLEATYNACVEFIKLYNQNK